jgi:beta-aspartyl-peptidase (threonine type)
MILHSGAGSGKFLHSDSRFRELRNAFETGWNAMKKGSSLDGVEEAVRYMEDAGVFNAGKGSCLTVDGKVQLDAAMMRGDSLRGAGVGAVTCTYNPVALARWLAENTAHILIVGEECSRYLKAAGLKRVKVVPSELALSRRKDLMKAAKGVHRENLKLWSKIQEGNTVGAVALDCEGLASAAVSTGGIWFKLPGRVGDSAIIGAGIYADDRTGAACATGTGEEIIRSALCLRACEYLRRTDAKSSARKAIALMSARSGRDTAGIITVDSRGRVGASWNTEAMGRAWYNHERGKVEVRI